MPIRSLVIAVAVLLAGGAARAQCPTVDRGSPTDGVTTVSLVIPPAPCFPDSNWTGWMCALIQADANDNGVSYRFGVRWNRHGLPCNGTVTWLQGGGGVYHRENTTYARGVQDSLDAVDGVRTIELSGTGQAFLTPPRNGFPNLSAVYADVLEFLVDRGVVEGVTCHFGNSAGSMISANALAYHDLDQVLDGVVFGGGPYWADLEVTCTDPNWADARVRGDVDTWSYREFNGTTPCTTLASAATPPYDCRSTLGTEADTHYPATRVSVIVGQTDPFQPWIDRAATAYFQGITAASKTFDRPANVGHTLMNFAGGASLVLQRLRDIVNAAQPVGAGELAAAGAGSAAWLDAPGPNPTGGRTTINYAIGRPGAVRLTVYDAAGRRVASLVDGERPAGLHRAEWGAGDDRGRRVPSGIYFVRLEAGGAVATRRIAVVR